MVFVRTTGCARVDSEKAFCPSNRLYALICYRRSEPNDEDESPEAKAERERVRRQANNARERYVNFLFIHFAISVEFYRICKIDIVQS